MNKKTLQFLAVHPVLPVRNIGKAIKYYTEKLGFGSVFQDDENDPKYAVIVRDEVELHLQWHHEEDFETVEKLALRFYIQDVESLFEEYKDKDVFHNRTALQDTHWGTREFAFFDLDSNGLFFYRSLNHPPE